MGFHTSGGASAPLLTYASGDVIIPPLITSAAVVTVTGTMYFAWIYLPSAISLTALAININGSAGTTGTGRLGVYKDAKGRPTTLIAEASATINTNTLTGYQTAPFVQTIGPGPVWGCLQSEFTGAAPTFSGISNIQAFAWVTGPTPTNLNATRGFTAANTGALPASAPALTAVQGNFPIIGLVVA